MIGENFCKQQNKRKTFHFTEKIRNFIIKLFQLISNYIKTYLQYIFLKSDNVLIKVFLIESKKIDKCDFKKYTDQQVNMSF